MADKLEWDIEMALRLAEEGANVTLKTALQLEIKQCTEEFFLTLDQALTATRRGNRTSGERVEDQEGDVQPRTRAAESREGRTSRSRDAQEAKFKVDALTKARKMRVLFSNKTDEAKHVIEEE